MASTVVVAQERRVHPFFRDFSLTGVTQGVTFVGNLLIISIIGRWMGAVALAEYLLLRRVLGWVMSGIQLGLGVALPRYVAHAIDDSKGAGESYFVAALSCVAVIACALGLLLNTARATFAALLFGNSTLTHLLLPLSLLVLGLALHGAVYGYYRGRLAMGSANILQCLNLALVPLAVVAGFHNSHSIGWIASAMGACTILFACLSAGPIFRRITLIANLHVVASAVQLLRYGLPRMFGDFGGAAIFSLPPVFLSHYLPLSQVSYILLAISVLMAISAAVAPLGLVLLSKVSMMLAQNRLADVALSLQYLIAAVVELSLFACGQVFVFADVLLRLWVGAHFLERVSIIRVIALAIPFYVFYVALRSAIDAASVTPYDARNNLTALAVLATLSTLSVFTLPPEWLLESVAVAMLISLAVLAWMTARSVRQLFKVRIPWISSLPLASLGVFFAAAALLFRRVLPNAGLLSLGLFEATVCTLFAAMLLKLKPTWFQYFLKAAFSGTGVRSSGSI